MLNQQSAPPAYKPLVMIVRSPHLNLAQTVEERDAMMRELFDVTHIRSLTIARLAFGIRPLRIFMEGMDEEVAEFYNGRLDVLSKFHAKTGQDCKFLSSLSRYQKLHESDRLPFQATGFSQPHIPDVQSFREYLEAQEYFSFSLTNPGELAPKQGFALGDFDMERLVMMLSVAKFYNPGISFSAGAYDEGVLRETWNAKTKGDSNRLRELAEITDNNLYLPVKQSLDSGINAVLCFGSLHELNPFREIDGYDAHWIDVNKSGDNVEVKGTIPYIEGKQIPEKIISGTVSLYQSSGLEVIVNIVPRPRVPFSNKH